MIEALLREHGGGVLFNDLPESGEPSPRQTLRYGRGDFECWLWEDKVVQGATVFLRSVYNVAASRTSGPKYKAETTRKLDQMLLVWPIHAQMVLDGADHLLYDDWVKEHGSRITPRRGSGSSFPTEPFANRNERWRNCTLPTEVMRNDEIRELNLRIFGWTLDEDGRYLTQPMDLT